MNEDLKLKILHIIFPNKCACCKRIIKYDRLFCEKCENDFEKPQGKRCKTCFSLEDSRDWREDYSVERIVSGVVENVKSGSICLFHNAAKNTPKALPIILERLIADGYEILPISKLIMTNNFTIDHAGRQIPCENT